MVYIFLGAVASIIFAVDNSLYLGHYTSKVLLAIVTVPLVGCIACAWEWIKQRRIVIHFTIIELGIIAFLLWGALGNVQLLFHPSNNKFLLLFTFLLVTLFVRQIYERQLAIDKQKKNIVAIFIRFLWILGSIQAVIGLIQYYLYRVHPPLNMFIIKSPIVGTIGTANGLGALLGISLTALVADWFSFQTWKSKFIVGCIGAVQCVTLMLNGCRGALLAFVCSGLVFVLQYYALQKERKKTEQYDIAFSSQVKSKTFRIIAVIGTALIVVGGIAFVLFHQNVESSKGRFFVWNLSLPMLMEHPVYGVGLDRYGIEYLNYQRKYFENPDHLQFAAKAANMKQPLNEYLQAFLETGWAGGILYLVVWWGGLWLFFRKQKNDNLNFNQALLSLGAGTVLLTILLHSMVDTPMQLVPTALIAYSILGVVLLPSIFRWRVTITSKYLLIAVMSVFVLYTGCVTVRVLHQYRGYAHWQKGFEYGMREQWSPAVAEYEAALQELPDNGELLVDLGTNLVMKKSYSKGIYILQQAQQWFNDRNIYISMSYAYLQTGNYTEAERQAKIAASMFPDQLAPDILLGEIYFHQGRKEESKRMLLKCIRSETDVQSADVQRISADAKALWNRFYEHSGEYTDVDVQTGD
jgi:O-antigen polymerase